MLYISDWELPQVAFLIYGYPVYHAYEENECSRCEISPLTHRYQILTDGADKWDPEYWVEFEITDLPEYTNATRTEEISTQKGQQILLPYESPYKELHKHILRRALISGSLVRMLGVKIKFPLQEDTFQVVITRTEVKTKTVSVLARSRIEAESKALDDVGNQDFSQLPGSDPVYKAGAYDSEKESDE